MEWDRLDDNRRAVLEKNPEIADIELGPEVILDTVQRYLISDFWERRRCTPADLGISLPSDLDTVHASHLRAMDRVYFAVRADSMREEQERLREQSSRTRG